MVMAMVMVTKAPAAKQLTIRIKPRAQVARIGQAPGDWAGGTGNWELVPGELWGIAIPNPFEMRHKPCGFLLIAQRIAIPSLSPC